MGSNKEEYLKMIVDAYYSGYNDAIDVLKISAEGLDKVKMLQQLKDKLDEVFPAKKDPKGNQ